MISKHHNCCIAISVASTVLVRRACRERGCLISLALGQDSTKYTDAEPRLNSERRGALEARLARNSPRNLQPADSLYGWLDCASGALEKSRVPGSGHAGQTTAAGATSIRDNLLTGLQRMTQEV